MATNLDEVGQQCDHLIDAALDEYRQPQPWQAKVIGIWPIELDGAIDQVTYQVGPTGATTSAARNCEVSRVALTYREKRRSDASRQAADEAQKSRSPASGKRIRREATAGRRAR